MADETLNSPQDQKTDATNTAIDAGPLDSAPVDAPSLANVSDTDALGASGQTQPATGGSVEPQSPSEAGASEPAAAKPGDVSVPGAAADGAAPAQPADNSGVEAGLAPKPFDPADVSPAHSDAATTSDGSASSAAALPQTEAATSDAPAAALSEGEHVVNEQGAPANDVTPANPVLPGQDASSGAASTGDASATPQGAAAGTTSSSTDQAQAIEAPTASPASAETAAAGDASPAAKADDSSKDSSADEEAYSKGESPIFSHPAPAASPCVIDHRTGLPLDEEQQPEGYTAPSHATGLDDEGTDDYTSEGDSDDEEGFLTHLGTSMRHEVQAVKDALRGIEKHVEEVISKLRN